MGIIYLLTHKETGRKYVGQTTQSLRVRLNKHRNVNGCPYIFNAIAKYGLEAFKVEEIGWSLDKEVLDLLETELIDQHQSSYPQGFNLRTAGQGVWHHEDTRKKIALKAKEQFSSVDVRNASALARGAKPFKVVSKATGETVWLGFNVSECERVTGICKSTIRRLLNGKAKSSKGLTAARISQ
jgi:hypothetical protein